MQFIMQPDGESTPIYICNGIGSSKIYELKQDQLSDDGVAINSTYTTYGFVNAAKAATLPIFGFHRKLYTVFQCAITGGQTDTTSAGRAQIRMLPNTLTPKYPYTVPVGIPLSDPVQDDFFRPINVQGNRMFVEVSTNAVGSYFNLSKMLLTGKAIALQHSKSYGWWQYGCGIIEESQRLSGSGLGREVPVTLPARPLLEETCQAHQNITANTI